MNLAENIEKLRCAKLQSEKEKLAHHLNELKQINLNNILFEDTGAPQAPYQGTQNSQGSQGQQSQQQFIPQKTMQRRGKKMPMGGPMMEPPPPPGQDPNTGFSIQAQFGIPDPQLAISKKEGGVAALKKAQQPTSGLQQEYPMSLPIQGFALTPEWANTQQYYLQNWFDVKEIPGLQQADKPTWQNLQISLANYFGSQVNDLMRKQRMLG